MSEIYSDEHRKLQQAFGTQALADTLEASIVAEQMSPEQIAFIEAQPMFFLSSVDDSGRPTVSYKGGEPGFVRVLNDRTLMFPSYDGNGMFYSMGNIAGNANVGLLFINFQTPNRLRIQGAAELVTSGPELAAYPGANLVARVQLQQVWVNCARYVHKMTVQQASPYVPDASGQAPVALWKRIEGMTALLGDADRAAVAAAGTISAEEYARKLAAGEVT